jgi:hypothetical protein
MRSTLLKWLPLSLLLFLGACATMPVGPSVMVFPGKGKSFEQFRSDDLMCRNFALEQVGGATSNQVATQNGVASAAAGTAVGAAAGALIGGRRGAAVGAGSGLLYGSMVGGETARRSAYYNQHWYDNAYLQCMYANGNLVPMPGGRYMNSREPRRLNRAYPPPPPPDDDYPLPQDDYEPPPDARIPPPPPGPPPTPPPGM